MKKTLLTSVALMALVGPTMADGIYGDLSKLNHNHDLTLPDWGPYTKSYIGVSHIEDVEAGTRFDLSVFPGLYRRKVDVPNAVYESGFHPWEVSPDLNYFSFRHEIEWKDEVYADISYSKVDNTARYVRMECVNNTEYPQSIVMHFMASMNYPVQSGKEQRNYYTIAPENTPWVEAESYKEYETPTKNLKDHLIHAGQMKEQNIREEYLGTSAIKAKRGGRLFYQVEGLSSAQDRLCIRYRSKKATEVTLTGAINKSLTLEASPELTIVQIPVAVNPKRDNLEISFTNETDAVLDGFAILTQAQASGLSIERQEWGHVAEEIAGPIENSIILKYPGVETYYGLTWDHASSQIRRYHYKELGDEFKRRVNTHTKSTLSDGSDMSYLNVFMRPIFLDPNSTKIINGAVCYGASEAEVAERIKELQGIDTKSVYEESRKSLVEFNSYPEGEKYEFSQKRMLATLSSNIVFPVFTQNQYIRHHCPGRWWNSLYTWDSGFIGIGFNQFDAKRAIENLNTYVNDIDEQSVFIHHGSMVPTQMYLYQEIWNATQSEEVLRHFYPKLKRYYEFMMGRVEGSTTRELGSGLIRTWDYFYNSGGWDDYPPQKACKSGDNYAPIVSTSHVIRSAKILKMAAQTLNLKKDVNTYDTDIEELTSSLNKYAWDAESGYFGYVEHNEEKTPIGIYRHADGSNYNKGLDGASPLFADVCTPEQQEAILNHLKSPDEIWCDIGLSTVDRTASYFTEEGYWNGAVWMPYQWIYWKSMLDMGEGEFAYKIATTALDTWKRETDRTYNCYEHFIVRTGSGAGWHQFSALSAPVLAWFKSYFTEGTFTTGMNVWIKSQQFTADYDHFEAELMPNKREGSEFAVVVCMNPDNDYTATWCGKEVRTEKLIDGVYNIYLPYSAPKGRLVVTKR